MNNKQLEKYKRNIDLINIAVGFLISIPMYFANHYINNSLEQSELLKQQTELVDELKTLYLESNNSIEISEETYENNQQDQNLSRFQIIEFKTAYIKGLNEHISLRNDLIKLFSSVIIAPLLIKLLINKKNKLKKVIE